jgi:uncharacterized protein YqgV (UPF0045/DUF77 family)
MAGISVQVSLYPLRQAAIGPLIEESLEIFRQHGLDVHPGPMSSVLNGEDEQVFAALRAAFLATAANGEVVMITTISNSCPFEK